MKLVSFVAAGRPGYGVVKDGGLVDLGRRFGDRGPATLRALLAAGALTEAERAAREAGAPDLPLEGLEFAPVIPDPDKIICVGLNYRDHVAETGRTETPNPALFGRFAGSQVGHLRPLVKPKVSDKFDYEGELAVVIGRICRDVPPEQATDVIHGYTIANDVTARDLQKSDVQFTRAKGFDSFCPLGPWIETDLDPDDFSKGRRVRTHLNGDVVQDGSTADLIFDIPTLIAHVSSVMTLLPGDVILTGTPEGVGPMEVGDEVEVSIEGIGSLTNTVATR
jgi:2-keto-4-pentenoate hydratase/2-oxohepta-3-ene-1,7-dioic acid hydratase in catechol pathway